MRLYKFIQFFIFALLCTTSSFGQGARYDNIAFKSAANATFPQYASNVNVAVCQGLATSSASVAANVAILVMSSNPITAGFTLNSTVVVAGFSGADTYFNGSYTIQGVTSTTISYFLTHANASATTIGNTTQLGTSVVSCLPLASTFTDSTLSTAAANPFLADFFGNYGFWAAPGIYQVQLYGNSVTTRISSVSLSCVPNAVVSACGALVGSANTFTALQTFNAGINSAGPNVLKGASNTCNLNFFRYVDALNLCGWAGAAPVNWTQSAINDCGATSCIVVVNANSGLTPANVGTLTLPDNVTLWNYGPNGRLSINTNPTEVSTPLSGAVLRITCAPPAYNPADPANSIVGVYAKCQSNSGLAAFGGNFGADLPSAAPDALTWGLEMDLAIHGPTSTSRTVTEYEGFEAVSAGNNAPTFAYREKASFAGSNTSSWKYGFGCYGATLACYVITGSDTGLQITQAITGSGSPQTITSTNVNNANTLNVNSLISVDSGGNQEDVLITATTFSPFTMTGIFTKNHSNPTNFTMYTTGIGLDFRGSVLNYTHINMGSIQSYNASGTLNQINNRINDSAGVSRVYEAFDSTNHHIWRDLTGTGWLFQNNAAVTVATLSATGAFTGGNIPIVVNFTTAGATTSDVLTITGATASSHCWLSASNALAATGQGSATTWLDTPGANVITLHHTNTNGQIFTVACTPN
jgi:hypothetical protein